MNPRLTNHFYPCNRNAGLLKLHKKKSFERMKNKFNIIVIESYSECRAWIRRKNDIQLLSFPVAGIIIIRAEQKDFPASL